MDHISFHLEGISTFFYPINFTNEEEETYQYSSRFIHADTILGGDTEANKADIVPALEHEFQLEENCVVL